MSSLPASDQSLHGLSQVHTDQSLHGLLQVHTDQSLHGLLQVHTEKQRHDLNRTGPLVTDTIQEVRSLVTHYTGGTFPCHTLYRRYVPLLHTIHEVIRI